MQYPVNLNLHDKRCLVVGGGRVATRKAQGLLACGANVHVIAQRVDESIRNLGITYEERGYRHGDVEGFRLVIAATDKPAINAQVFDDCEEIGVWVNAADEPDSCSFTLPAVVRRDSLMLTASTGGSSPALSSWLRARLESEYGDEYADLLDLLAWGRAQVKAQGLSTESLDWNSAIDAVFEVTMKGDLVAARTRLKEALNLH